jgi:hypothetical protein
VHAAP